jgi:hypothetical protein
MTRKITAKILWQQILLIALTALAQTGSQSDHGAAARNSWLLPPAHLTKIAYVKHSLSIKSRLEQPIELYRFELNKAPRLPEQRIFLQSGLHGNEKTPVAFSYWLMNRVAQGKSKFNQVADRNLVMDFVPIANPDGFAMKIRQNSAGVNLNRNFAVHWGRSEEHPGGSAFSEPETAAIEKLFAENQYHQSVDIHGYVNWLVLPSKPVGNMMSDAKIQAHQELQRKIEDARRRHLPSYEVKTALQLGDGGAFEDWAFWQAGVEAFCLELSSSTRYLTKNPPERGTSDLFLRYEDFLYAAFVEGTPVNELATSEKHARN